MSQAGQIHTLDENELKHHRKGKNAPYSPRQRDTPILSEKFPFAFSSLLSPVAIQRAVINDIGGESYFRLTSSRGTLESDVGAVIDLLGNITNPSHTSQRAIVQMTSPTINRAKHWMDIHVEKRRYAQPIQHASDRSTQRPSFRIRVPRALLLHHAFHRQQSIICLPTPPPPT